MKNLVRLESFKSDNDVAFSKIKTFVNTFIDEFSFVETDAFLSSKPFLSEIEITEGVLTGYATVDGAPIYLVAQNNDLLGGSLGKAGAEKICKCIDKALRAKAPLVSIINSSGARVGEGVAVMEAYASILSAATAVAGVIPHICVVKGNAVGLQASFCALADFIIALPEAVYSVGAPMSVLSKSNDMRKPNEVLGAKSLISSGCVHFSPENEEEGAKLIKYLVSFMSEYSTENVDDADFNRQSPVLESDISVRNVLDSVCDADSYYVLGSENDSITLALGYVGGKRAGLLLTKGELSYKSLQNATRFINFLDSFDIPLLTFIDSTVIKSSLNDEYNGAAEITANLFYAINASENLKISVILGNAIGFSYTAFASKNCAYDYVFALPDAVVAPVTPALAVDVLYADEIKSASDPVSTREKIAERYETISDVFVSAKEGYIDNVIEPSLLRPYVISALQMVD